MENISLLSSPIRQRLAIEICPYFYDHHLEGKAVYSAAEALILLARVVKSISPQFVVGNLTDACFPRFLSIPADATTLAVSVAVEEVAQGGVAAALLSSVKSPAGNINRTVEHARVTFAGHDGSQKPEHPFCSLEKLEGECINVPAAAIYRELVPFGKAYQNICGDLSVSHAGALAYLSGGDTEAGDDLLGSPFPFDAALHMACVWAQRFADVVPFPVGFAKRTIYQKTKKRVAYLGRIVPVEFNSKQLIFNAWILDLHGSFCEVITGIQMQDVSKGRKKPPAWIKIL